MTNDPANIVAALRSLALYGVCALLAIIIGVLMTNPLTYTSLGFIGIVCAILFIPFLLRWHHPLMIIAWNMPIYMFFIRGNPILCLVMITLSLVISLIERALNQRHFIKVPQITWPLCFLVAVVLITAALNGGIGLHAFGSDVIGGKKYIFLAAGIIGYFALTARTIPPEKARWYVGLYFLGGALSFVGDLYSVLPHSLEPIFWALPPATYYDPESFTLGTTRLVGTGWAAVAAINALIAIYGLRGIFLSGKLWRPFIFFILLVLVFLGGFRSGLFGVGATFFLQFFLEGLHRTKLMPFVIAFTLACAGAAVPLASKLPFTFQRTLAFLPASMIQLSPDARMAAEGSTQWRIDMWKGLLPEIPKYLLVGKGYAISQEEFAVMGNDSAFRSADAGQQALALSGDYHNGPLSVIIPFGIWGAIGFLWFTVASLWVMYRNYRYSDPKLGLVNMFLFTSYVMTMFDFYFISGGLSSMTGFTGILGMSIAINRGVRKRPPPAKPVNIPFKRPFANIRLQQQPAMMRRAAGGPPPPH